MRHPKRAITREPSPAEEMRRPERDLPRALFASMAASIAIYVLVALSAIGAVGWPDLGASDAPLALAGLLITGRGRKTSEARTSVGAAWGKRA